MKNFHFLAKSRPPPQGRTVWPISTVVESLYTPNYPALVLQTWSDSLQRLRSYCWETERRSVRPNCSVYPVGKNCIGSKYDLHFLMDSTFSITVQSLGMIIQRALAVGAKMWCFMSAFFVTLYTMPARCSFEGVYFEQALYRCLWVDFNAFFQFFFQNGLLFQMG